MRNVAPILTVLITLLIAIQPAMASQNDYYNPDKPIQQATVCSPTAQIGCQCSCVQCVAKPAATVKGVQKQPSPKAVQDRQSTDPWWNF
ncbi:MAG: hypothetical protein A2Z18_02165 [Armatimonadetes bacterium RBG_16_58_9]|nr:MAG: hypothetical protein A2Z18_02165 [Armatimonadetes bacterium RBG_16_58_9]